MNPKQQDRLLRKTSLGFAKQIRAEINRYINLVSESYDTRIDAVSYYLPEHRQRLLAIWQTHVKKTIILFGEGVKIEGFRRSFNYQHTRHSKLFDYLYTEWLKQNGGMHIQAIADTTRNKIQRIIQAETLNEVDTSGIRGKIRELKGISAYRAKVIALTETHSAAQYASHETAVQIETDNDLTVYKEWVPVEDERTRESHADMADHEPILLHEMFDVDGVQMERPSDPRGGAENVINCRCSLVYSTED
jgi:hypothetical protein